VTNEIRRLVWPELRREGFTSFTGRTAWRYAGDAVDVVNFRSFGPASQTPSGARRFRFGERRCVLDALGALGNDGLRWLEEARRERG
jgi:hypothetical protein